MRVILQRVSEASVRVEGKVKGEIGTGMMLLLGIEHDDNKEDADWLIQKITQMRIFSDDEGKMNLSIRDIGGRFLVVSQFTLHASTKKGNRPSFIKAARPEHAVPLYSYFIEKLELESESHVEKGEFGADMKVSLINDGPVTFLIEG